MVFRVHYVVSTRLGELRGDVTRDKGQCKVAGMVGRVV